MCRAIKVGSTVRAEEIAYPKAPKCEKFSVNLDNNKARDVFRAKCI